jgi:hypothetical protein
MEKHMFASRKVLSVVAGLGLLVGSTVANAALAIGDANYVGSITDGIPSNPTDEVTYVNALTALAAGTGDTTCAITEVCNREGSTLAGPFAAATTTGAQKDETEPFQLDAFGFEYIVGKYDAGQAGSLVWYFAGGYTGHEFIDLPDLFNGKGLSHISLYNGANGNGGGGGNGTGGGMPEPGTLALAGIALLGAAVARRRQRR